MPENICLIVDAFLYNLRHLRQDPALSTDPVMIHAMQNMMAAVLFYGCGLEKSDIGSSLYYYALLNPDHAKFDLVEKAGMRIESSLQNGVFTVIGGELNKPCHVSIKIPYPSSVPWTFENNTLH